MTLDQYLTYCSEVHAVRNEHGFADFYSSFTAAYARRLNKLGIEPYEISEVRAIEAAAFERAGGTPEDHANS
jgi:hypothetical protein